MFSGMNPPFLLLRSYQHTTLSAPSQHHLNILSIPSCNPFSIFTTLFHIIFPITFPTTFLVHTPSPSPVHQYTNNVLTWNPPMRYVTKAAGAIAMSFANGKIKKKYGTNPHTTPHTLTIIPSLYFTISKPLLIIINYMDISLLTLLYPWNSPIELTYCNLFIPTPTFSFPLLHPYLLIPTSSPYSSSPSALRYCG